MESMIVFKTNEMEWIKRISPNTGLTTYNKQLVEDEETGVLVKLTRYPAGVVIPLHTHPCAHGIYVLEGVLHTGEGDYGPGSFLWFPEGGQAEHGATANGDVSVLFVTNKKFEIHYLHPEK